MSNVSNGFIDESIMSKTGEPIDASELGAKWHTNKQKAASQGLVVEEITWDEFLAARAAMVTKAEVL